VRSLTYVTRSPLILATVLAGTTLAGAQSPATGVVTGQVTLTRVRGTALPSNVYQPRAVGQRDGGATPELQNVVVYLKNARHEGALPIAHKTIRQEREVFFPRVLAVTRGSTIEFPNGDPVFHNVFSLSAARTFDLGRYPQGKTKSVTLTRPGLVKVFCHIHSHMSASILVLDHPYFTAPEADGSFTLRDVPPGTYSLIGWHERVGERAARVEVVAGGSVSVSLTLPVEDEP
jgi:plastocyanin